MNNNQKIDSFQAVQPGMAQINTTPTFSEKATPVNLDEFATKAELIELENKYLKSKLLDQKWTITTAIATLGLLLALTKLFI